VLRQRYAERLWRTISIWQMPRLSPSRLKGFEIEDIEARVTELERASQMNA
jgi:hypothetical protein